MWNEAQAELDRRVLVLPLTLRDGTTEDLVALTGCAFEICANLDALVRELDRGAGALVIPEEAVSASVLRLTQTLNNQPAWSDLPVLVVTGPGASSADARRALKTLGNVTLIERPLRAATLASAIRTALRGRERQYQMRSYVAERTRTEQALREADRRKDEFLATLGHELRNPLSPLVTSLHLLKFAGPTDPIVGRTAAVMHRQLTYLVRLVDDLLEVSRITRGVIAVSMEPVELVTILALAIESSRPLIDAGGHELIVDLPHESMMIRGDSVRLTQAFSNVINNAAIYTPAGGHIWITATQHAGRARVAVRDDGIGLAPDQQSSIFEMFAQVNRTDRRTQGGLGIGLTLSRSLIAIHGGAIRATSDGAGRGSTFEIELPLTAGHVAAHEDPDIIRTFDGQRLLIVDDNVDAREMLSALLSALGAAVRTAPNGIDALETVQEFKPDAVVLDIGLPGMDGREVARQIRGAPGGQDIVLIALTGWGQDEDLEQSRLAGFDHHLVKPPDINRLADIIAAARRGRQHQERRNRVS